MSKKTLSGTIRERLPSYELRLFNGERQSVFVDELVNEGLKISIADFRTLLYRARKKGSPPPQNTPKKIAQKETAQNTTKHQDVKKSPKGFTYQGTQDKNDLI